MISLIKVMCIFCIFIQIHRNRNRSRWSVEILDPKMKSTLFFFLFCHCGCHSNNKYTCIWSTTKRWRYSVLIVGCSQSKHQLITTPYARWARECDRATKEYPKFVLTVFCHSFTKTTLRFSYQNKFPTCAKNVQQ